MAITRMMDAKRAKKAEAIEPTPEQRAKGNFVEQDIVDVTGTGRVTIGKAYRRLPKFEKIEGLGVEQIKALRYYRAAFDDSERSETTCALNVRPFGGGGSGNALSAIEARTFGSAIVRQIEGKLGGLAPTMHDVALLDLTFSEVAMKRFGSRDWIVNGKSKVTPRSGRHRTIIRDEWNAGLTLLVKALQPYLAAKSGKKRG